jgi:Na+/glutamate symporter
MIAQHKLLVQPIIPYNAEMVSVQRRKHHAKRSMKQLKEICINVNHWVCFFAQVISSLALTLCHNAHQDHHAQSDISNAGMNLVLILNLISLAHPNLIQV